VHEPDVPDNGSGLYYKKGSNTREYGREGGQ